MYACFKVALIPYKCFRDDLGCIGVDLEISLGCFENVFLDACGDNTHRECIEDALKMHLDYIICFFCICVSY